MPNDSRNNYEVPCYMDAGAKLFAEGFEGQTMDFVETNRDVSFVKHNIREELKKGFKPLRIWLFDHIDATSGNTGPSSAVGGLRGVEDLYGDGGPLTSVNSRLDLNPSNNLYREMKTKVFRGPFTIKGAYTPNQGEQVMNDMTVEKIVKESIWFLQDDCRNILGRQPYIGDLIERFDGKILEIRTSSDAECVNWEWIYTFTTCENTSKDVRQLGLE